MIDNRNDDTIKKLTLIRIKFKEHAEQMTELYREYVSTEGGKGKFIVNAEFKKDGSWSFVAKRIHWWDLVSRISFPKKWWGR